MLKHKPWLRIQSFLLRFFSLSDLCSDFLRFFSFLRSFLARLRSRSSSESSLDDESEKTVEDSLKKLKSRGLTSYPFAQKVDKKAGVGKEPNLFRLSPASAPQWRLWRRNALLQWSRGEGMVWMR